MPTYKVYRNEIQERRSRQSLAKWRWVALSLSAILLGTAAMMFVHAWH